MRHTRTVTDPTTGRRYPIPAGGSADDIPDPNAADPNAPADDGDPDDGGQTPSQLRAAADDGRKARQEAETLKRENAFLKAGVKVPDGVAGKYLLDTFEGDELTPETIRAHVGTVRPDLLVEGDEGAGAPPPDDSDPDQRGIADDDERGLTDERRALASGAQPRDGKDPRSPYDAAYQQAQDAIAEGATTESAIGAAIGHVMASDDQRVFVPEDQVWEP